MVGVEGCVALSLRSKSEVNEGIGVRMGAKCALKARCACGSEAGTVNGTVPWVNLNVRGRGRFDRGAASEASGFVVLVVKVDLATRDCIWGHLGRACNGRGGGV